MRKITEKIENILADMGRTYWYFEGTKYGDDMCVKYYLGIDELSKDVKNYTTEDYESKLEGMNLIGLKAWKKYVYFMLWFDEKIINKMISGLFGEMNRVTHNGEFECEGIEKVWINILKGMYFIINEMESDKQIRRLGILSKKINR